MINSGQIRINRLDDIIYGIPAAQAIVQTIERLGCERVFVMASGTLTQKTDEINMISDALGARLVGRFSAMPPHTPRSAVIEATNGARQAEADVLVTIGGGSITDGAKAVQLCLANDITTVEGLDAFCPVLGSDGVMAPPPCIAPTVRQIAVPTTLSGGEFSAVAGITNEVTATKEIFRHPDIAPVTVVIDPSVARHTPEWLWLSTGIRALDHCVEGICSLTSNIYSDTHALRGLNLLVNGLAAIKEDPTNLQARLDCQLGAWLSMGTTASGVPMGASHGIGYALGALCGVPHGHTSCIMLPSVMRWNSCVNADRQKLVSKAMGRPREDAGDVLDEFIGGLGMPRSLSAVEIGPEQFDGIAEQSMNTPWIPHNPRTITKPSEIREILEMAK